MIRSSMCCGNLYGKQDFDTLGSVSCVMLETLIAGILMEKSEKSERKFCQDAWLPPSSIHNLMSSFRPEPPSKNWSITSLPSLHFFFVPPLHKRRMACSAAESVISRPFLPTSRNGFSLRHVKSQELGKHVLVKVFSLPHLQNPILFVYLFI